MAMQAGCHRCALCAAKDLALNVRFATVKYAGTKPGTQFDWVLCWSQIHGTESIGQAHSSANNLSRPSWAWHVISSST
jgi:hypothetical protein